MERKNDERTREINMRCKNHRLHTILYILSYHVIYPIILMLSLLYVIHYSTSYILYIFLCYIALYCTISYKHCKLGLHIIIFTIITCCIIILYNMTLYVTILDYIILWITITLILNSIFCHSLCITVI